MTFKEQIIKDTIAKLLKGEDHRIQVVNEINVDFLDYMTTLLVDLLNNSEGLSDDIFGSYFLDKERFNTDERVYFSSLNLKTITNVYKSASKKVKEQASKDNYSYLKTMIENAQSELEDGFKIELKISNENKEITLPLVDTYLLINAFAAKKMAIRGGAWSSIGKTTEKPLIDELCKLVGIPEKHINNKNFKKDETKDFDREVDYILYDKDMKEKRIEVKLMGQGNPESADATIARDSDILVADTLSDQNKNQLSSRGTEYLELKGNKNVISDFKKILDKLNIPYTK